MDMLAKEIVKIAQDLIGKPPPEDKFITVEELIDALSQYPNTTPISQMVEVGGNMYPFKPEIQESGYYGPDDCDETRMWLDDDIENGHFGLGI